jgi:hypothetical protein
MPIHASIEPDQTNPLIAVIDIDQPDDMPSGDIIISEAENLETAENIAEFDLSIANRVITATNRNVSVTPEKGFFTARFRGDTTEHTIAGSRMVARATNFMKLKLSFLASNAGTNESAGSAIPEVFLNELSLEYVAEIATAQFSQIAVSITNRRQFPRRNIPLPGPGATATLARCGTGFSGDTQAGFRARHDPAHSFVSRQLVEGGPQSEQQRIQNHEQRHMDIISALIDCANIAMEIAGTGKTGNQRRTARNAMFAQLNTFLGPQQRHLHDLYDDETQNGTIATEQQDWDDNFVTKVVEEWQAQGGPEFRVT